MAQAFAFLGTLGVFGTMGLIDFKSNRGRWLAVILVATILTAVGWFGGYPVFREAAHPTLHAHINIVSVLAMFLLIPGSLFAVGLAALFSPGGVHDPGGFMWLAAPISWLFYFGIGALRVRLSREGTTGLSQTTDKTS